MLLLSLGILGAGRARAQAGAEGRASANPERIEVVVTGTRTPEQALHATVKTDVVTRQEAERRNATNVAEALATQPGVQVNPGGYGYLGTISPIQIQGFDLGRVLILEDGEPVIGDVGGAIDLAAIPIGDVERIEVVAGPTSALYGSSALGGVVNIITAPPGLEGVSARGRAEYRTQRALVLEGNGAYRIRQHWFVLDLARSQQVGISQIPDLPDFQIPAYARSLVGLRAGTQLNRNIDVQLRARWLHQRVDGLESQAYPGLGRYVSDLPQTTDRVALHFLETIRLGYGSSLRFSLARQWVEQRFGTVPRESSLSQEQSSSQATQSFESTATFANGQRTWVVGARFETQTLTQELRRTERVDDSLVTRVSSELVPQSLGSAALYGQLAWKVGRFVTVLPGIRAEYHRGYDGVVAPRFALALRPSEPLTVRAAVGRGFRTPSAEELGFNFDHSIYGYKVVGNPQLSPERSWGINGDVAWNPVSALGIRAGAFLNLVDDLIDIDLAQGSRSGTVVSYKYKNFERVRTAGGNLATNVRVGDRLRADAAYDYLWTRDLLNNEPVSGRPAHTVTASVRLALPSKFELYARTRVVSDAYVSDNTRSPAYETVDVRLSRELWPRASAYAGVLNLFDVHQDPGRAGDLRPPLGRVLYVGLRSSFAEEP
ncbi:MAG: TonB-dependent receptor [Polyangiaceae bacterium]